MKNEPFKGNVPEHTEMVAKTLSKVPTNLPSY